MSEKLDYIDDVSNHNTKSTTHREQSLSTEPAMHYDEDAQHHSLWQPKRKQRSQRQQKK